MFVCVCSCVSFTIISMLSVVLCRWCDYELSSFFALFFFSILFFVLFCFLPQACITFILTRNNKAVLTPPSQKKIFFFNLSTQQGKVAAEECGVAAWGDECPWIPADTQASPPTHGQTGKRWSANTGFTFPCTLPTLSLCVLASWSPVNMRTDGKHKSGHTVSAQNRVAIFTI